MYYSFYFLSLPLFTFRFFLSVTYKFLYVCKVFLCLSRFFSLLTQKPSHLVYLEQKSVSPIEVLVNKYIIKAEYKW